MSNPFELRFKLLEMAQSYLSDNYARSENMMYQAWDDAKAQGWLGKGIGDYIRKKEEELFISS